MKSRCGSAILLITIVFSSFCDISEDNQEQDPRDQFLQNGQYLGEYWPTAGWRECAPSDVGVDPERLLAVYDYAANPNINTHAIFIVRKGYVIAEAYFDSYSAATPHESFSVAKSFTGALIGIAISKGFLTGVGQKAYRFFPPWQDPGIHPRKKRITIRHLLTMSSGLDWDEDSQTVEENDVYGMGVSDDYLKYILDKIPTHEPGTTWNYSSGDSMLLSGIIQAATGKTALEFARNHLLGWIGLANIGWESDPTGATVGGWGITATAREYAKLGYLYLNKGWWDGVSVVPSAWVAESTSPASNTMNYFGYHWWLAPSLAGYSPSLVPEDTFIAWGLFTQRVFVVPSKDLVVVRLGDDIDPAPADWDEVTFLGLILNSIL